MIDGPEIYDDKDFANLPIATGDVYCPIEGFARSTCGGIVLTPMCDLALEKINWIKLALALPFRTYLIEEFIPGRFKGSKEYREEVLQNPTAFGTRFLNDKTSRDDLKVLQLVNDLKKILYNTSPLKPSHYYLPGKTNWVDGYLVDFTHIISVPYNFLKNADRISRLKSPWREQLVSRYVGFSLRVGTEDYSLESVANTIHAFFQDVPLNRIKDKLEK